jgi:glutathione synthase/RimK-type ligase-like ATP-grasp enzyme
MRNRNIIFLITPSGADHFAARKVVDSENYILLPKAFADAGWSVFQATHESISLTAKGIEFDHLPASKFDLIWSVGFGPKKGFLDRAALFNRINTKQMITPSESQILLHGKSAWVEYCPETHIANQPSILQKVLSERKGQWVLKPMAGSFGDNVQLLNSNQGDLIQTTLSAAPNVYFCLQRFLPQIVDGEVRTLIAGEEIIGSYLRKPVDGLHANLSLCAEIQKVELAAGAKLLVERIHDELISKRIGFAAIDTVGDFLMEVNLVNPGGLGSLNTLYQKDHGAKLVKAVERFCL